MYNYPFFSAAGLVGEAEGPPPHHVGQPHVQQRRPLPRVPLTSVQDSAGQGEGELLAGC